LATRGSRGNVAKEVLDRCRPPQTEGLAGAGQSDQVSHGERLKGAALNQLLMDGLTMGQFLTKKFTDLNLMGVAGF
jgi:hypothetical protein